ncbi:MAG TPA: hypothetical protein VK250_04590 [Nitrososphaeraceae archaeon]|nr:hypothetical protein [Nitrososphaeraceae archaeon]
MPWELRWFENDMTKYKLALDWFKTIDEIFIRENLREDRYIFLRNCKDIGIKLRPFDDEKTNRLRFRLEIKWRKDIKCDFSVTGRQIYGNMEDWTKWGWILDDLPVLPDSIMDPVPTTNNGPILKLEKLRFLRRYLFQENTCKSVEWLNIDTDEGLQCEITKVMKEDAAAWWTIGFESIGKKNNEIEFRKTVQKILKDFKIKLERKNSVGYPEWIKLNYRSFS